MLLFRQTHVVLICGCLVVSGTNSVITEAFLEVSSLHSQFGVMTWDVIVDTHPFCCLPPSTYVCDFQNNIILKWSRVRSKKSRMLWSRKRF